MSTFESRTRTLGDWIYNQSPEDQVCVNRFHETVLKVYEGWSDMDPYAPDEDAVATKVAQLLKAGLVLLGGDVVYVKEGDALHTLGDSVDLLSYYMHTDSKEARKAIDLLETNFQGYFPVVDGRVWKDVMRLDYPDGTSFVDLKTLEYVEPVDGLCPEFGAHRVDPGVFDAVARFFEVLDSAVGEPWFFEKVALYHFTQPYREKSFVLVGGGGNGKSMFMGLMQRLYGGFALTDAPQPKFSGHDSAVISYNFVGKRLVTFNDVGDPSSKFLEWLKRMITGNLEVKTPSGSWLSVPCNATFMMETNHVPEVLGLEAHRRRFVIKTFDPGFKLKEHMSDEDLDHLGDRGDATAADVVNYLVAVKGQVDDWTSFGDTVLADDDGYDVEERRWTM